MKEDAKAKKFDVIVVEDVDRLSRNLGDLAKFVKIMNFCGVFIYSLSKGGFISDMDVGFKGTMSAQFLKDLSQKTKRGLAANVRKGKAATGAPYGYRNTAERGVFKIDEETSDVVRRIFTMSAEGLCPRQVAAVLNKEGVPSPRGGQWNASTIGGHKGHGVGILRNSLYIGMRIWNRTEKVRDPETGKRLIRTRPTEEYVTVEAPELQFIDQELWDKVQSCRRVRKSNRPYPKRRGYLLSGLMFCGQCGGTYTAMTAGKYAKFGCSSRREKGVCGNRRMISRSILDNCVLSALETYLLEEENVTGAVGAFEKEYKYLFDKADKKRPKLEQRILVIL